MKVGHLTEEELRRYRQRSMSPAALLAADDHLAECGDCRESLGRMEKGTSRDATLWRAFTGSEPPGSRHLSHDELVAFAEDDWNSADRQQITEHLRVCTQCREDAEDLKSFRDDLARPARPHPVTEFRPRRRSAWIIPLWAGATASLLLAIFVGYRFYRPKPQTEPTVLVQLSDGGGNIKLNSTGQLVSPSPFDPGEEKKIKDALLSKRIEEAAVLSQLASPRGKLLSGTSTPPSFELVAPIGTVVLADRPVFHWQPMPGASGYVVSIYDSRFHKVVESPRISQNYWEADHVLARGPIYTWQVRASVKGKTIRAPVPPAPEARFQVLSQTEAEQLEKARREHANSHLLLGILYARAGALDDSERELGALVAANPDSSVAKELLASLQQLRHKS
ncbi:MAG TPA: hypothetical protein VK738_15000 [Terriglobales bacterium]|nr:hypothetical protein [Terriglobales bacterium]